MYMVPDPNPKGRREIRGVNRSNTGVRRDRKSRVLTGLTQGNDAVDTLVSGESLI